MVLYNDSDRHDVDIALISPNPLSCCIPGDLVVHQLTACKTKPLTHILNHTPHQGPDLSTFGHAGLEHGLVSHYFYSPRIDSYLIINYLESQGSFPYFRSIFVSMLSATQL